MSEYKIKDKFSYWLDSKMSKGTISIIRLLTFAVAFVVIFVSMMILLFNLRDSIFSAFWDSLATIINAEMPSSEDGVLGYIILNTITAVVGLFFTSTLIGVISSAIEEKLGELRKGNSNVLEKDHIVVLGYNNGEHGLLKQLIQAAGKEKRVIVIFTDLEKPDMEDDLQNNVDIPKNIKVLCRNGDIKNINDLRCCSIDKASMVIINALHDNNRIKSILAVLGLKKEYPDWKARIVACVTDDMHMLPASKIDKHNMIMFKTNDFMAKLIAHTATEPGISFAFRELLNFEGNELYFERNGKFDGKSILDLAGCVDKGTIVGVKRDGQIILNPQRDLTIREDDELIIFEEERGAYKLTDIKQKNVSDRTYKRIEKDEGGNLLIFGSNILLETILDQLHDDIHNIAIVSDKKEEVELLIRKYPDFSITLFDESYKEKLEELAAEADHIIMLSDREMEKEDADVDLIMLLLKLADIRERFDYDYNIAVELNMESSYNISVKSRKIDYIIESNVSSLVLAQMAENAEAKDVFVELLSKEGNELYTKRIRCFNIGTEHDYSYNALKQITLSYHYTLIGYIHDEQIVMNALNDDRVFFSEDDRLIVLGKE